MSTVQSPSRFLRRFDDVWTRLRRVSGMKAVSVGILVTLLGFSLLVVSDFSLELPMALRRLLLGAVVLSGLAVVVGAISRIVRWWNAGQTAAEIERTFPELGQSVRTAIEFGRMSESELQQAGISPALMENLQTQTDRRTLALDLPAIVRTGTLILTVGLACFLTGSLLTSSAVNGEWRTAVQRSLLANNSYTNASATSGDLIVQQGQPALLTLKVSGRVDREIRILTRPAMSELNGEPDAKSEWTAVVLTDAELKDSSNGLRRYEMTLPDIQEPFEYQFKAGPASTELHSVTVRYPLQIVGHRVTLTPPEYTRLPETVVEEPSFTAIDGSQARLEIALDRIPAKAVMMMRPAGSFAAANATATEVTLQIDGTTVSTEMPITDNWRYIIQAVDADGVEVKSDEASIRVRRDQSPRVWFEKPTEELEVHTLAEVMMKVRTSDDFGLANAGIVFEINNESSHTLLFEDFTKAMAEAELSEKGSDPVNTAPLETSEDTGEGQTPFPTDALTTNKVLEELLPLEYFELTQRDSVSYFAFAEDNYPQAAHRTETELRFIDIRPFRQLYELYDMEDPMGPPNGEEILLLGDLIRRERALLNRTIRVAQRVKAGGKPETDTSDALIEEQQTIADATLRFADFLVEKQFGGEELIYEAHEAMLGAITSLSDGRFDDAVAQERDAIKLLVEGRDVLRILIRKNPPKNRAALRAFSRQEAQKLRRPKSDAEELSELIERLTQLEKEEQSVSTSLAMCMNPGGNSGQSSMNGTNGSGGSETPKTANENPDSDQPKNDGENGPKDDAPPKKEPSAEDSGDAGEEGTSQSLDELRQELEERQHAAALEARDIESKMQQVPLITELARQRMAEAARTTETAAEMLTRGDTGGGKEQTEKAEQLLGELRRQAEALLKEEIAQQIAAARDLANRLAQQQSQLQKKLNTQTKAQTAMASGTQPGSQQSQQTGTNGSGSQSEQPQTPEEMKTTQAALAEMAKELAETGRTLDDVTKAIANSDREQDQESAAQVGRVRDEQQLAKQVEQMEQLASMIEKDDLSGAQAAAGELSERLVLTAQELEGVHRRLVAPRLAKLMELEQMALGLVEKLKELETAEDIAAWHREAQELLAEIDKNQLGGAAADKLRELLKSGGGASSKLAESWQVQNGYFVPPQQYGANALDLAKSLQQRIQEVFLGDMQSDTGDAVPPEYERFVERYYEVLSSGKDEL